MSDLQTILLSHLARYAQATTTDFLKLLYQQEFGCGHLLCDRQQSFERLLSEWRQAEQDDTTPLYEEIGNGFSRLHLAAAKQRNIPAELVFQLFYLSAQQTFGSQDGFLQRAEQLLNMCRQNLLPYSQNQVQAALDAWKKNGCVPFSHSQQYATAYRPAYRVVRTDFARLLPCLCAIDALQHTRPIIIGIDGRCGAGKSTLARLLGQFFDANIIQMDDFFLPLALRTPERLSSPGGNIHYERFRSEVLEGLKNGGVLSYRIFDCQRMEYCKTVRTEPKNVTIIEGAYSMHPFFEEPYDFKIFCDVDATEQKRRIVARNGEQQWVNFETRWIPMEEQYFQTFLIKEVCDFVLSPV